MIPRRPKTENLPLVQREKDASEWRNAMLAELQASSDSGQAEYAYQELMHEATFLMILLNGAENDEYLPLARCLPDLVELARNQRKENSTLANDIETVALKCYFQHAIASAEARVLATKKTKRRAA